MRPVFAQIDKLGQTASERDRRTVGGETAREGYAQIQAIRRQWAQPAPQLLQDRSQQAEQHQQHQQSTDGPAVPGRQKPERVQSAPEQKPEQGQESRVLHESGGQAAQFGEQQEAGGQQPAQSAELQQAMRAGVSGAAPMSSARPLATGEQGSRRVGAQPGQERQGPERGE
ncbi:hypothetical protein [Kribbella sp. CA-293567]|uniref:hypothetical protein n=1 Tax=Kribbella sp. CA-293567 TaxID=3002436 RepID=UPI0022DE2735|nr:hypothetical protein [Kribbella sp. CA-293567]WBQ05083.1 hypothetical protein OX958_34680 [Kribbella sp. CA-293567]